MLKSFKHQILAILLGCSAVFGQVTNGNLTGVILDPTGAAVAKATVQVESLDTGLKAVATTDDIGKYKLNSLPVG